MIMYDSNLRLDIDHQLLMDEFEWYLNAPGRCSLIQNRNKIVQYFQQDSYFHKEKELWLIPTIRNKLINNRCKYLQKNINELTTYDLLTGFKRSGIYYGYSGFNPLLGKWFYDKYHIKTCYDPCGGWGHRLLGALDLDLYIYNDISRAAHDGVRRIIEYFEIPNTVTYNRDCRSFIPHEDFECIFTCPPYYNQEIYEPGPFRDKTEYYELLDSIFKLWETKSCKVLGIVNQDRWMTNYTGFTEKILLPKNSSHHLGGKSSNEYLYIYER